MRVALIGESAMPTALVDILARHEAQICYFSPDTLRDGVRSSQALDLCVVSVSSSQKLLRTLCVGIRKTSPATLILLVAPTASGLEDPDYDERIGPDASITEVDTVLRHIQEMMAARRYHGEI